MRLDDGRQSKFMAKDERKFRTLMESRIVSVHREWNIRVRREMPLANDCVN